MKFGLIPLFEFPKTVSKHYNYKSTKHNFFFWHFIKHKSCITLATTLYIYDQVTHKHIFLEQFDLKGFAANIVTYHIRLQKGFR